MKTKKDKDRSKSSSFKFISGDKLTEEELQKGIKIAESGSFYTVQESKAKFEKWLHRREKK